MKNLKAQLRFVSLPSLVLLAWAMATAAYAQITPLGDAYTNTATPTKNFGAATVLDVESSQTTYIQFNLSSIPSGYTSADITQATLKLYVNAVATEGSFNVDYVNGTWTESTIDASNAPALGTTIAASVPLTTADKNQYILVDVTAAVQAWLSGTANDGVALVANSPLNASFDSKENEPLGGVGHRVRRRRHDHGRHDGQWQRPDRWRHQWHAESSADECVRDESSVAMERQFVGMRLGGYGHDHGGNGGNGSHRRRHKWERHVELEHDGNQRAVCAVGGGQCVQRSADHQQHHLDNGGEQLGSVGSHEYAHVRERTGGGGHD